MLVWIVLDTMDGRPPAPLDKLSRASWRVAAGAAAVVISLQIAFAAEQLIHPWARVNGYPAHNVDAETRRVRNTFPSNARILGWDSAALVLPSYGVKVVAFPRPMPLSPSDALRQADVQRFFNPRASSCERHAIAVRWGATHIAYLTRELRPVVQAQLRSEFGPALTPSEPWRVIALSAPQSTPRQPEPPRSTASPNPSGLAFVGPAAAQAPCPGSEAATTM
jgi:hypothetical protein